MLSNTRLLLQLKERIARHRRQLNSATARRSSIWFIAADDFTHQRRASHGRIASMSNNIAIEIADADVFIGMLIGAVNA